MKRLDLFENEIRGIITYELDDGRRLNVDADFVRRFGVAEVMRANGIEPPKGRLPVFQCGHEIGTLPAAFDPLEIKPTSWLYEVRAGDFKRTDKGWEAAKTLCPGDFEAIPQFRRKEPQQ